MIDDDVKQGRSERIDCDVAVVGCGPVGATLAALLGQAGLRVFVGDASDTVYPLPRAAHFDHEVMRVFQQLDIVDAIGRSITPVDRYVFQNAAGEILLEFDLREPADTGWKGYMMHQPGIENAIRDRISADEKIDFRTGLTFRRFDDATDHVTSHWQAETGSIEVRSRFLVGCDGAWSAVREGAGIVLEDLRFDEPWLVLDVVVDKENGFPDHNIQYCDPARPMTYVVMGDGRRRLEFMLKPDETAERMLEDEAIAELLEPMDTRGLQFVERRAVYRFHALIARDWRQGRVLIAGDAAHQMPPFAGQGMCSGVRDAAALAWRLPLAMASSDSRLILDSYRDERDPHVRAITSAAVATGRVVCTLDSDLAADRDAQMLTSRSAGDPMPDISSPPLAVRFGLPDTSRAGERFIQPWTSQHDGRSLRMDDVLGSGAWMIASGSIPVFELPERSGIRLFSLEDPLLASFRGALTTWLAVAKASAVLVRADRYVFGTGNAHGLLTAYVSLAGLQPNRVSPMFPEPRAAYG